MAASVARSTATKASSSTASGVAARASGSRGGAAAWLHAVETAVYGSFQVIQRKHEAHTARTVLGAVAKLLQLCAFALSAHAGYRWAPTVRPIQVVAELTTIPGYTDWMTPTVYIALYYAALAWVFVFVGLFLWATASFMRQSWPVLWPLRVLAAMGTTSATLLYIPLFYLLMSGFTCHLPRENPFWLALGYTCYTGGHLAQTVIAALLVAAFVTLCTLFTLVYLDSNPLSVNLAAKAHGRADFLFLIAKTALVVLVEVYPHAVGADALAGMVLAAGVTLIGVYAWAMPYAHHVMNQAMLAIMAAFAWLGLCAVIAQAYPSFDAAVMVYAGGPMAALAGANLANWRANSIARCDMARLWSPYEAELKVRYFLHAAVWGHATDETTLAWPDAGVKRGGGAGGAAGGAGSVAADLDGGDDTEARVLQVRALLPHATVKAAEAMWRAGIATFKDSALLHIFAARFYGIICANHHMQMSHLIRAERREPAVDIRFLIFQARKVAEDASGGKGTMTAVNRVAFEKHLGDAKRSVHLSLARQAAFWGELANPTPDITRCHRVLSEMNGAMAAAEVAFGRLLELNSQSLLVLRMYAEFTMYVVNNTDKANILLAEAERLEEQQAKDHERETGAVVRIMEHSNLDVLADNTAVVAIGASYGNLGTILSVSPYTTKLFGYSRWQLERRNINMLIPSPIAEAHDDFLRRYLECGEGRVVDYTRVVFGLHRAGHIFPMLLCVREQPASEGPPAFVGIMRTLNTTENHIVMRPDYVVTAASQASLVLLNVEPSALASSEAKIQDWVAEWDVRNYDTRAATRPAVLESLRDAKGTTLCFDSAQSHMRASVRFSELARTARAGSLRDTDDDGDAVTPASPRPLVAPRDSAGAGGSAAGANGSVTWVRAHLQQVPLPNGSHMLVLHWARLPTDTYTLNLAERRRRESLGSCPAGADSAARLGTGMRAPAVDDGFKPSSAAPGLGASVSRGSDPAMQVPTAGVVLAVPPPPAGHLPVSGGASCPVMRIDVLAAPVADGGSAAALPGALASEHEAGAFDAHSEGGTPSAACDAANPPAPLSLGSRGSRRYVVTTTTSVASAGAAGSMQSLGAGVGGRSVGADAGGAAGHALSSPQRDGGGGGGGGGGGTVLKAALRSASARALGAPRAPAQGALAPIVEQFTPHGDAVTLISHGPAAADSDGSVEAPVFYGSSSGPRFPGPASPSDPMGAHSSPVLASSDAFAAGGAKAPPHASAAAAAAGESAARGIVFVGAASAQPGDRGSHASSRRSVGRRLQDRLRRSLTDDSQALVAGLVWLRASGIAILLLTLGLAIGIVTLVSVKFDTYADVQVGCRNAQRVQMYGVEATEDIRYLVLAQRPWVPIDSALEALLRSRIMTAAGAFSALHRDLYAVAQRIDAQNTYDALTVPAVAVVYDPFLNGLISTLEPMSLLDAGLQFADRARRVAGMPLPSISRTSAAVTFVLSNALKGRPIHDAFNATIFAWLALSGDVYASVLYSSVVAYGCMVALVVLLGAGVMLPILLYVDRARDRYLLPFVQLPPVVPAKLRANAESRLRALRTADADAEDGGSSDDDAKAYIDDACATAGDDGEGDTDWGAVLHVDAAGARVTGGRRSRTTGAAGSRGGGDGAPSSSAARTYRKSSRSLLWLVAKFMLPLVLVLGCFSVIFGVTLSTLQRARVTQQLAAVADQRWLEAREAMSLVRYAVGRSTPAAGAAADIAVAAGIVDALEYHHRLLTFVGTPAAPVFGDVTTTNVATSGYLDAAALAAHDAIMFGDACAALAAGDGTFDGAGCAQFRGGVLTRGLHGALADYIALCREELARRAVVDVLVASSGVGVIHIANGSVPYSTVAELVGPQVLDITTYANAYLDPALAAEGQRFAAATLTSLENAQRFMVGFVAAFLLLFAAYQLLVYLPQVHKSNGEVKNERVVVLLLPTGLLQTIPQLQELVATMVDEEDARTAAS